MKFLRFLIAALMLCVGGVVRADDLKSQAQHAAIADGVSTAVGLAVGAAEMNPLGPIVSLGVKFVILRNAETMGEAERVNAYATASSFWSGAAANNICVTASIVSGGAFAPACIALGVAWGMKTWQDTENERIFWNEGCPSLRQYVGDPSLKCVYTPLAAPARRVAALDRVDAP